MTVALTCAAVALLAVSIILSRIAHRQLSAARKALTADEMVLTAAGQALQEALRARQDAEQRHAGLEGRVEQAQADVRMAQQALDAARQAPVERLHVLDRRAPRSAQLWSVTVVRSPNAPGTPTWTGERTCLIAAVSRNEALERVMLLYPRTAGFDVQTATPCPLFQIAESEAPRTPKRPQS